MHIYTLKGEIFSLTAIVAIWLRSPHSARNVKIKDCREQERKISATINRTRKTNISLNVKANSKWHIQQAIK